MKNFIIFFLFSLIFLSSCDVMKRKYTGGFYVGSFSKRNSSEEKNIQISKSKKAVENKCVNEIISCDGKIEKEDDLLSIATISKKDHSKITPREKNEHKIISKKNKTKEISRRKIDFQKIKRKNHKIVSPDWLDKITDSDFWLWFFILLLPPGLILVFIKDEPVAVILYTICWAAGIFCLFFFTHLLWLSIILVPAWGFVSLSLGVIIYIIWTG